MLPSYTVLRSVDIHPFRFRDWKSAIFVIITIFLIDIFVAQLGVNEEESVESLVLWSKIGMF